MTTTTTRSLPAIGSPIEVPWSCPDWCTSEHATDGYSAHGHIVHQTRQPIVGIIGAAQFWLGEVHSWKRRPDDSVEVILPVGAYSFSSGDDLRAYADEMVRLAVRLDEMNAQVHA